MTLIVETGTASSTSEAYASVADCDAYFAAQGVTTWEAIDDELKEQALRRATTYMQQEYRGRWIGLRVSASQALDWPRADVRVADVKTADGYAVYYLTTEIPVEVKAACIALAGKATTTEFNSDTARTVDTETVGPLTVKYAKGSSQKARYPAIDMMLKSLLTTGGISLRTGRA